MNRKAESKRAENKGRRAKRREMKKEFNYTG
jgi:hypothetical protein